MIILFKQVTAPPPAPVSLSAATATATAQAKLNGATGGLTFQPIVIIDYTRSDDQWGKKDIAKYTAAFAPAGSNGNFPPPEIYSLAYTMTFKHNGIAPANALKTSFNVVIPNAPLALVALLNVSMFTSQQNVAALAKSLNAVIDPQVAFPSGGFVVRGAGREPIVRKNLVIYSAPYSMDSRRVSNVLTLNGASFDSMVMRLKVAFQLNKEATLFDQIKKQIESKTKLKVVAGAGVKSRIPTIAKIYPPAPLESLLSDVCIDNNLAFDLTDDTVTLEGLSPKEPPRADIEILFCFENTIRNSFLIANFSLNNYVACLWEAQAVDVKLFTSVAVYDDSRSPELFANLTKLAAPVKVAGRTVNGYRFYVQDYALIDGREKTSVVINATNNWLVNNMKLDNVMENSVYKNAAAELAKAK